MPPAGERRRRTEAVLLCVALVGGLVTLGVVANSHYRFTTWLFWRYLSIIGMAAWWTAGCASMGLFLLERLGIPGVTRGGVGAQADPWRDALPLAFPLGVLAFQLAIFVVGLAGG